MSGRLSKRAGSAYEYRVRDWFKERSGWDSKRIALSGAMESLGRHDVHSWMDGIYLIIECKKRTKRADPKQRYEIEIKKEWIDDIWFAQDELLVFAVYQSPHYVFLPVSRFFKILGRNYNVEYSKDNTFRGTSQFKFKKQYIDQTTDGRYHFNWNDNEWIILTLEDFVTLRETATISDELSIPDQIQRITTMESAEEFEEKHLKDLSYKEKRMLYGKFEELEAGSRMNPVTHAFEQFWLDDAFVCICPKCGSKITKKDL